MGKKQVGFNFTWMFVCNGQPPLPLELNQLDFLADNGFNFVRIPTDYHFWTNGFHYDQINEGVIADHIDRYIVECNKRGLHASLNLHRAPGYCINRSETEIHNLWADKIAQDGFNTQWQYFAKRYKGISNENLSFDLVNEPCDRSPTHPCTREANERVMRGAAAAIRAVDPTRRIVVDGFNGGGSAIPELADLGAVHSGRGYFPMQITHYKANWVKNSDEWALPAYPGEVAPGQRCDIDALRDYYRPWKEVEAMGVEIHMGECGVYNRLPNPIALRWLADLITVFNENHWGFALWNFKGPFGLVAHGRPGTEYTQMHGLEVDKAMLNILRTAL